MFKNSTGKYRYLSIILFVSFSAYTLIAKSFTPNPEMLSAYNNLSVEQQQDLMSKYNEEGVNGFLNAKQNDINYKLGSPTTPRIVDNKLNTQRTNIADKLVEYKQKGKDKNNLQYFGYNVFAGKPVNFTPVDNMPVPDDYIIGPGDGIDIQLFGKENSQIHLKVNRTGAINFPKLGPIQVSGYKLSTLEKELTKRIKKQITGVDVVISFGKLRAIQVFVTGDAYLPGAYNMNGLATVTQALIASGGIDTVGSLRNIQVLRQGKVIQNVDLYDLLIYGDSSSDIRLRSGDTVFVPSKGGEFKIRGEIKRPAIYELKNNPSLNEALKIAGGINSEGLKNKIRIQRKTAKGVGAISIEAKSGDFNNFHIRDGDEVIIDPITPSINSAIFLHGAVVRPGNYHFKDGMKVTDIISDIDSDLLPQTDLSYALIVRETNQKHDVEVLQFDLKKAINHPDSDENIELAVKDEILIFSNYIEEKQDDKSSNDKSSVSGKEHSTESQDNEDDSFTNSEDGYFANSIVGKKPVRTIKSSELTLASLSNIESNTEFDVGRQLFNEGDTDSLDDFHEVNKFSDKIKEASREKLLAPLANRLKQQARYGKPVKLVEISGAVQHPGIYPLSNNARIKDLVMASGGVLESVYPNEIELSRFSEVNNTPKLVHNNLPINLSDNKDETWNFLLKSKDRVNLRVNEDWKRDLNVEILGEIKFPGSYTIGKGEMLSDILKRAGGLTEFANPKGSVFTRVSVREQEEYRNKIFTQQLQQDISLLALRRQSGGTSYLSSPREAVSLVKNLEAVKPTGRIIIKLTDVIKNNKNADIILEDGDKIYIPPFRKLITVMGQVQSENTYIYEKNLSIQDYIQLAGGTKKQADKKRIYVIRANGAMMVPHHSYWFKRNYSKLEPGDTIVVPVDTDYIDKLSLWSTVSSMITNTAVTWGTIHSIVNR